jgi:hypothetical protein
VAGGGGGGRLLPEEGGKFIFHWFPPPRYSPTHVMFIALEDCLLDYDCQVEFGGIMVGGAALFRNVDTA